MHVFRVGVSKCGARFETLLRDPTQWCVEIFEWVHGVIIEIGNLHKGGARKGDAKTSPAEISMDSAVKLNNSKNYNTH